MSKKVTLSADGATATVAEATVGDIFLTVLSTDSALTGAYGLTQRAGLFVAGMATQNVRMGRGINPFSA